jgi:hypothetical protein
MVIVETSLTGKCYRYFYSVYVLRLRGTIYCLQVTLYLDLALSVLTKNVVDYMSRAFLVESKSACHLQGVDHVE